VRKLASIRLDLAIAAALMLVTFVVYRPILRLWWMYDDPFHINLLKNFSLLSTLTAGDVFRALQRPLFTPFQMLSLKSDLVMFGQQARGFYAHQLIALLAFPMLMYCGLRLASSRFASAAATMIATLAGPTLDVIPLLMLRHYVEGAVAALTAAIFCVLAFRRDRFWIAIMSAAVYFLAAGCKEIYVPLPLLFAAVPIAEWRTRFRLLIPHALAAMLYAAWRLMLIGHEIGTYSFVPAPGERLRVLLTLPLRMVRLFAGSGTMAGWMLTIGVLTAVATVAVRIPAARLPLVTAFVVGVLPILPVAADLQSRWAFMLWISMASLVAFVERAIPRHWVLTFLTVSVLLTVIANRAEWPAKLRSLRRMSDEARVVASLGPADILRNPSTPSVTMLELERMTGSAGRAFYDDLPLCRGGERIGRIFEYDPQVAKVRESSVAAVKRSCGAIREMPLSFELQFAADGTMYWRAGPYSDGVWSFILADGVMCYDVPARAGFKGRGLTKFSLRVRYTSPAGWRTYTPMLAVEARQPHLVFQRR
jgi:hypothetical protein